MNSFKFTSSPWGFRNTPLIEQCDWLRRFGIAYICGQFSNGFKGLFEPSATRDTLLQALETTKRYGLKYASFNVSGDFMLDDIETQIKLCCEDITRASIFAPEVIIVFAGWQQREDAAIYSQVSYALKQISKYASQYNLKIALENHGGLTKTPEQINKILSNVNEPNIGVNYDPANFEMYGVDAFQALLKIDFPVVFTHFKSLRVLENRKQYCRISQGIVDYGPILQNLKKSYHGFYAIEYEEHGDVFQGSKDDLNALKKLIIE
ncbi:MAG: hypothetical protein A2Y12_17925 [Planctomycetes bacterium GWF2_42_9]|nr:MAG: hypothetical protein A2Y12_17925 [Planctomycetes bacterium GWF2_42_9]